MNLFAKARSVADADGSHGTERGFSLIEVTTGVALMTVMVYGLHATLLSATNGRTSVKRTDRAAAIAQDYAERLQALPFGTLNGGASAAALEELFDDDDNLGNGTLRQLRVPGNDVGHWFVATVDGLTGRWRVRVSGDLNNDGDENDTAWREGRNDLLAIQIWFDDRLVVRTMRAAPVEETIADVGANY